MDTTHQIIGGYTLLEEIGDGGQAKVYRARQESTGQIVAAKLLNLGKVFDKVAETRFRGDMEALAALEHASIVPLIDYVEQDETSRLLVMKYVDGGDLSGRIKSRAPESAASVERVVEQVGGALAEAHAAGILHRDVKPGNVLVDRQGHCLLTDFGIAKREQETLGLTEKGTSIGTVLYMSPEQGQGKAIDGRSDLYSLAAIAFEMLTGRRAFEGESFLEVTLKKEGSAPPFLPDDGVGEPLQQVLTKALDPKADRRQASVADFVKEFSDAVSKESGASGGMESLRTAIVDTRGRDSNGKGLKVAAAALVLACAGAAGFKAMTSSGAAPKPIPSPEPGDPDPRRDNPDRQRRVFMEPELPHIPELMKGPETALDVVLLLDEGLLNPNSMADVTREVLQPLAAQLRVMDGVGSVSFPPVVAPIAGPDATGLRRDLLDLDHDIAVVLGVERVRSADVEVAGVTRRRSKIRPGIRIKAMLASSGAEAPFASWASANPVLGLLDESGADAQTGIPSAIREASSEAVQAIQVDVATLIADLAARGNQMRVGVIAPENDRGVVARFERTLTEFPQLIKSDTLPKNDWTFEENGKSFVRTSAASSRDQDAIEVEDGSHMEFWNLRQRSDRAQTVQFIRQSLEDWVQFDSARLDYEESWGQRESEGAEGSDVPDDSASDDDSKEQAAQSSSDLLEALNRDRPVELRYTVRVTVGSDLTLFEVRALPPPVEEEDEENVDDGGSSRAQGDLRAVMSEMTGSVYLPVGVAADGTEAPLGSAWVVGEGVLATNGHVVAAFDQFDRVVMRRVDGNGQVVEFEVSRHKAHPGYLEFARQASELSVLRPNTLAPALADYHDIFDVALVWVEEKGDGWAQLGKPFELASRDEVVQETRGVDVAYMGFPCEASSNMLNVSRPTPVGIRGTLTGAVDTTMGAADPEMSRILRVDVPLVGGASGSVVFRGDGKVLGLVNSGAVIGLRQGMTAGGLTRIAVSGFGYIQRVDTLSELLEGRAAAVLAQHKKSWDELLERDLQRFEEWVKKRFVVGFNRADGSKIRSASLRRRSVVEVDVFSPSSLPSRSSLPKSTDGVEFDLNSGSEVVAVAVSDNQPLITIGVYYSGGGTEVFEGEGPVSRFHWSEPGGSSVGFRGYRVIPEALSEQGVAPEDVGKSSIQVFLFDVE
ncbi:MAG: protein kinase [Planctomycetota bacterium]